MLVKKPAVNALLPMLCKLRFTKFFQLGNHVYCHLNNSTSEFYLVLSKSFSNFSNCAGRYSTITLLCYASSGLLNWTKQTQANSGCQGHNGTDKSL